MDSPEVVELNLTRTLLPHAPKLRPLKDIICPPVEVAKTCEEFTIKGFTRTSALLETNFSASKLNMNPKTDHCDKKTILVDIKLSDIQ